MGRKSSACQSEVGTETCLATLTDYVGRQQEERACINDLHKTDGQTRNIPAASRIAASAAGCETPVPDIKADIKDGIKILNDVHCFC